MGHGLYTKRDFQVAEEMAWHKLTTIDTPSRVHFPEISAKDLYVGGTPLKINGDQWRVPVSEDDGLPCGEPFNEKTYSLFTPWMAWDYVEKVLSGTGYTIESIGMIRDRRRWFISAHLDELEKISGGNSESKFQLNFSGGMDRQFSPQCELSNVRIVCQNTLSVSRMHGEVLFKVRATQNFFEALESTSTEIENAVGMAKIFQQQMDTLDMRKCSADRAQHIYAGALADPKEKKISTQGLNRLDKLMDLFEAGRGNEGRTELDVLNGFTEYGSRYSFEHDPGKTFVSSEFDGFSRRKTAFASMMVDKKELEETTELGKLVLTV